MPGKAPPATSRLSDAVDDVITERWNSGGYWRPRCGSLATIAALVPDFVAATTQLFEPTVALAGRSLSRSARKLVCVAASTLCHGLRSVTGGLVAAIGACAPTVGASVCACSVVGAAARM